MKIAIDVTPLEDNHILGHRVRGTGFYIENLKKSLLQYFPENTYIFFTRGEILHKDIDVVHYPYFEPFFLSLPFRKNSKTVVTVHDLTPLVFPDYFPAGIRGTLKWWFQKMALKKVDAIITDSQSSKRDIVRYTGISDKKITVVYLAAGQEYKQVKSSKSKIESLRGKYHLPEKFVLYVGDVTWNKNLPRLIEAVKKTNTPLVMTGKALVEKNFDIDNPWNQDLLTVQNLTKGDKQIVSIGFVPIEELALLYNIATVFVMPSLYEGFGLPILEAMCCGCPVITTKEGSLAEIGGNAVLYVDAYSIDSIAEGISRVSSNESLRKSLIKKGLEQAALFSWQATAKNTVAVYEKVNQK